MEMGTYRGRLENKLIFNLKFEIKSKFEMFENLEIKKFNENLEFKI